MKKVLISTLAAAGFLTAVGASAAGTATVNVSANVVGNCQFNTASATMAFGALDPSSTSNASAAASLQFWCTKNATYNISDDLGGNEVGTQRRLANGAGGFINYSIGSYTATGAGLGKTSPITLNLNGSIANADYVDAAAGTYGDAVLFTITP